MSSEPEILFDVAGGVATVTLNRPKALNALSLEMIRAFDPQLKAWAADDAVKAVVVAGAGERAFCAGGDVRAVWQARGEGELPKRFFFEEYRLNRRIHHYPKPYVALIDGIAMGGGLGVSVHGSHRVVTERTVMAMPETGIGLFPDIGATWFLNHAPGEVGTYLALTGTRLHAADAIAAGLGTHYLPAAKLDALVADLRAADWSAEAPHAVVDRVLRAHAEPPERAPLLEHLPVINHAFRADSVEGIIAALAAHPSPFAAAAREALAGRSPTSMKVALRQLREGRGRGFDDCLIVEYRLSQGCMAGHDYYEGIRALLIDKDNAPRWQPATLAEVSEEIVARHFAKPPHGDLTFAD